MLDIQCTKWVDSVLESVKSNIEHILQIWSSIGFDEKRIEKRIHILKNELDTHLRSLISEEEKKVAALHIDVEKLETQVVNLSGDLGIKVEPTDSGLSLLDRQKLLSETRKKLSETISSRMDRFKALSLENQHICAKLGESPKKFSFETIPSPELLESMDDEINDLLLRLSHKDDSKSDSSNSRKEANHPECESARGDSLITSVIAALAELHELYNDCLVDSSIRDNFPLDCPPDSISTTYLEKINLEIARWKEYRAKFADAISSYNSWCASFARLNEIEDLINQGKGSERLEKEATSLREKILPDLEKLLALASRKSRKFKIYGQPPTTYVQLVRRSQTHFSKPSGSPVQPIVSNTTTKRPDMEKGENSSLEKPRSIPLPTWSLKKATLKSNRLRSDPIDAPCPVSLIQSEPITPKTSIPKLTKTIVDPKVLSLWKRNKGDGSSTASQHVESSASLKNETTPIPSKNQPSLSKMFGKTKVTSSSAERSRTANKCTIQRRISKSFEQFKVPQRRKSYGLLATNSQKSSEQSILDLWYKKKDTPSASRCGSPSSVKSEMAPTTNERPLTRMFGMDKSTASSVDRLQNGIRSAIQRRVSKSSEKFKVPSPRKSSSTSSMSSQKSFEQNILDLWYKKKDTPSASQCGSPTSARSEIALTASRPKKEAKAKGPLRKFRPQLTPEAARILSVRGEISLVDLLLPSDNKENDKNLIPQPASGKKMNTPSSFVHSSLSNHTSKNGPVSCMKNGNVKPTKTAALGRAPRPTPTKLSSRRPISRNPNIPDILKRLDEATGPVPVMELLNLKQELSKVTTLNHLDTSSGTRSVLKTDAFKVAVRAVLQQMVRDKTQSLSFFSKKTTATETRYGTFGRELLAIYLAVKHFRHILEGRQFTIFTDQKPLIYAFRAMADHHSPGKPDIWISSHNSHIGGASNVAADAISHMKLNQIVVSFLDPQSWHPNKGRTQISPKSVPTPRYV
nr:gag pol polyprotein [Hymenolepis microstoma]